MSEQNWKQAINEMLEDLIRKYELPEGSLYMSDNFSQKDELISHTVAIWEPSYPRIPNEKRGQNKIIITIFLNKAKSMPDLLEMNIREVQEGDLHRFLPEDATVMERTKSDLSTNMVRIRIKNNSPFLVDYVRENAEYCIKGYSTKADRFACCSQFEKCSDEKKCIHENKLYSKACSYRTNLESGRIFYGKNCNV